MFVMALPWLLVLELVLYAGCSVCGIIAAASLAVTQGHFGGQCILYGSVTYNTSAQSLAMENSGSPSLCVFVSAVCVCLAIYCFSVILYWAYTSCVDDNVKRGSWWLSASLGVCVILLFFQLVTGCVLRIGRDSLCLSVLHNVPSITVCEEAENRTWTSPHTGKQFYTGLHSAERSVWVSFFFWVLVVAVMVVQKHQGSRVKGDEGDWSRAETEPFFHRPARPK